MAKASEEDLKKAEANMRAYLAKEHPDWPQERKDAYVYGRKRAMGWKPSREK
jgi:hypothetical protein